MIITLKWANRPDSRARVRGSRFGKLATLVVGVVGRNGYVEVYRDTLILKIDMVIWKRISF